METPRVSGHSQGINPQNPRDFPNRQSAASNDIIARTEEVAQRNWKQTLWDYTGGLVATGVSKRVEAAKEAVQVAATKKVLVQFDAMLDEALQDKPPGSSSPEEMAEWEARRAKILKLAVKKFDAILDNALEDNPDEPAIAQTPEEVAEAAERKAKIIKLLTKKIVSTENIRALQEMYPSLSGPELSQVANIFHTEGLQAAARLAGKLAWQKMTTPEQVKKITDTGIAALQSMHASIQSVETQEYISNFVNSQVYGRFQGKELDSYTPEKEKEIDRAIGPTAVMTSVWLSEYTMKFLDEYFISEIKKEPDKLKFVIGLGVNAQEPDPSTTPNLSFLEIPQEDYSNISKRDYVYLPGKGPLWLKRDRKQLMKEVRYALKTGINNLQIELAKKDPNFLKDLMVDVFEQLDNHMALFTNFVAEQKERPRVKPDIIMAEVFGDNMHPALQGATPEQRAKQRKKHDLELSNNLLKLLFPRGVDDIPLPVHFREVVYRLVLPSVSGKILDQCMSIITTPKVMNKILFNVISTLPKPKDLEVSSSREPAAPAVNIAPKLQRAAGKFLINIVKLMEPGLAALFSQKFEAVKQLITLSPQQEGIRSTEVIPSFEELVERKMGNILGGAVVSWLSQFEKPRALLDWAMLLLDRNWLVPELEGNNDTISLEEQNERVVQELSQVRQNLGPYVMKSFKYAINSAQAELSNNVNSLFKKIFFGAAPAFIKLKQKLAGLFGEGISVLSGAMNFAGKNLYALTLQEKQDTLELRLRSNEQARIFRDYMHSKVHDDLVRKLFTVVINRLSEPSLRTE